MEFNPSVITTAGQALIAEAIAGNINIIFTKIETGDGTHAEGEDLSQLTQLTSPKQQFPLTSKEVLNANTVHLKYIVSNVNPDQTPLTTGYYVKELGLYAKSDLVGATEVLYAVATVIEGRADWLPPYNELQPSTITMDWYTAVGNASTVTIQDGASAYALADDLGQVDDLDTTNKSSLVDAVNEVVGNIGSLNTLDTDVRTSIVNAINDLYAQVNARNAGSHNGIYRGKNLGTSVTAAQWASIQDGTFLDMYIGDYWVINGRTYRIAAFDYWLGYGDTECTTHHVVIVPDASLYSEKMNDTSVTTGGYVGSKMYTTNLASAKTTIKGDFGAAHILSHREYLTNAITSGYASAGAWYDSDIELMNEVMVYGTDFFTPHNSLGATIPNTHTIGTSQLPLFALDHSRICNRSNWWLRDVVSSAHFALVIGHGVCYYDTASYSLGVRPAFGIIA